MLQFAAREQRVFLARVLHVAACVLLHACPSFYRFSVAEGGSSCCSSDLTFATSSTDRVHSLTHSLTTIGYRL